jgi:hypothetical protein
MEHDAVDGGHQLVVKRVPRRRIAIAERAKRRSHNGSIGKTSRAVVRDHRGSLNNLFAPGRQILRKGFPLFDGRIGEALDHAIRFVNVSPVASPRASR